MTGIDPFSFLTGDEMHMGPSFGTESFDLVGTQSAEEEQV